MINVMIMTGYVMLLLCYVRHVYGPFEFRTSLGNSILLGNENDESIIDDLKQMDRIVFQSNNKKHIY